MARTAQPKITNITKTLARGSQDLNLKIVDIVTKGDKKVKLMFSIKSDSYAFQSHAKVAVWDDMNMLWSPVHNIHYDAMKTPAGLYYQGDKSAAGAAAQEHHFNADLAELRRIAYAIIF